MELPKVQSLDQENKAEAVNDQKEEEAEEEGDKNEDE